MIATTVKQGQKLVELGDDLMTADMSWRRVYNEDRHRECYELKSGKI